MLTDAESNAGYSSVGRASDCRRLQQSDGPWFDSGWPDVLFASLFLRHQQRRRANANDRNENVRGSLVASISARHAEDQGSTAVRGVVLSPVRWNTPTHKGTLHRGEQLNL